MKPNGRLGAALLLGAALALGATGCSTIRQARGGPGQKLDPWEGWNRKVFAFNEDLDKAVLKPVATGYANAVPQPVRRGIDNFFENAADAWSAVNSVLQGKVSEGLTSLMRFGTNSVFGIFGIFDVASDLGIERHKEDLGQTLGVWGVGAGAYVVWPLFGPSSVRDSVALPFDRTVSPALVINDGGTQVGITALQIINLRAGLLGAGQVLDDIALDKYTFIRDAYLQRRRSLVYDGNEPPEPEPPEPAAAPGKKP